MLFNGLESFPGNSVIQEMQRIGMDIGPHINAYVSKAVPIARAILAMIA